MERGVDDENFFQRVRIALFLVVFLLLVFQTSVPLAESLEEGAKREGKVMFYSQMTVSNAQALMSAFQKKYPFVKAELYRAGAAMLFSKVLAEKRMGKTFADVIGLEANLSSLYKKEAIPGKYISPESKLILQGYKDQEGFWTAYYVNYYAFAYNTKMVTTKDIPKTSEDLLHPRWKGKKIGLYSEEFEWFMGMLDFMGEEKGRQFMKRLADQDLVIRSGRNLLTSLMVAGEFPLSVTGVGIVRELKKEGAPIDIIPFPVPPMASMRMIAIHANAPHPNAAKLLIDFILSKEGQSIVSQLGRDPVRMDIPLEPEVEKNMRNSFPIKPRDAESVEGYRKEWNNIFKKR